MTPEELCKHEGTVWSWSGIKGLFEYKYISQDFAKPVYGMFQRISDGKVVTGIQLRSCYTTKRAALEAHIEDYRSIIQWQQEEIGKCLEELRLLDGGADKGI